MNNADTFRLIPSNYDTKADIVDALVALRDEVENSEVVSGSKQLIAALQDAHYQAVNSDLRCVTKTILLDCWTRLASLYREALATAKVITAEVAALTAASPTLTGDDVQALADLLHVNGFDVVMRNGSN